MSSETENLELLRIDLAERSFWNIGYFMAGFIFWLFVAIVGVNFPLSTAKVYWLVGTFFIFPVAVVFSRVIGAEPYSKQNRLAELVGYTHMSVITLSFPLLVASFIYFPDAMILIMAIAYCLDFYVMSWAFGSPLFGIHAAVRMVLVSTVWFAFPELRFSILPLIVAAAYLLTVVLIPPLRARWMRTHAH